MKKVYFSPEIEIVNLGYFHNILESTWIGEGDGEVEAKGFYGSWEIDDEDEDEDE